MEFEVSKELESIMFNFLLMKLGGQISFSAADLTQFTQDYAGYRFAYDTRNESITLTSKLRTSEFPAPDIFRK